MEFNKEMLIEDALKKHPGAVKIFIRYGMECIICGGVKAEIIERGTLMHGVNLEALMDDLNSLLFDKTS